MCACVYVGVCVCVRLGRWGGTSTSEGSMSTCVCVNLYNGGGGGRSLRSSRTRRCFSSFSSSFVLVVPFFFSTIGSFL